MYSEKEEEGAFGYFCVFPGGSDFLFLSIVN